MPKQLFENTTKTPRTFYGVTLQPGEQKLIDVPPETVLPPAPAVVQRDPVTKKFTAGGVALPELDYLVSGAGFRQPEMAVIGDSRAANSVNKATVPYSTNQSGIVSYALALSDGAFRVPDNGWFAVGSQRVTTGTATSDLAPMSVQVTQAIAGGFKNVTVFPFGTNDYEPTLGPVQTVPVVWAEYKAQVQRLIDAGMKVWVCTDPGVRPAEAASTAKAKHAAILQQNELIRTLANISPGKVVVIDLHAAVVDSTSSGTTASPPASLYQDTVHFNGSGNYWLGKAVGASWLIDRPAASIFTRSNFDNYLFDSSLPNKLANSLLLTDTGTTGVPDEWKGGLAGAASLGSGVAVTPSIVTAPSGPGNALKLVWTADSSATFPKFGKYRAVDVASRIPNGATVYLLVRIKVSGITSATTPRVKLEGNGGISGAMMEFANDAAQPEANILAYVSAPFTKTSSMTQIQLDFTQKFLAAGGITYEVMTPEILAFS